jgi:hypothetical protein
MRDLLSSPDTIPLWEEAITFTLLPTSERPTKKKNRTIFPPYGRDEFDALLGDYDAVADLPVALFKKELIEAYPEAKVIVTTRNYDEWEKSMQESVWLLLTWRMFRVVRYIGVTQMAPLTRLMHLIFRVHNGNHYGGPKAREAYEKYYEEVRELVPAHRRLEIASGQGRWEPLIDFLGVEKEKREGLGPYPNLEENTSMAKGLRGAWWDVMEWFLMIGFMFVVTVSGAMAIYWQRELWAAFERMLLVFEPYVGFSDRNSTDVKQEL